MFKPMLAHVYDPETTQLEFPVAIQPKYDGIRLLWDCVNFETRNGKPLRGLPQEIEEEVRKHFPVLPLDGELYSHILTFEQISGAVRAAEGRTRPCIETGGISYIVFDWPSSLPFERRIATLKAIATEKIDLLKHVTVAPTRIISSKEELTEFMNSFVAFGYEGIMIRDLKASYQEKRTRALLKWKKTITVTAEICDFFEGEGKHAKRLGAILVIAEDGKWCCSVGTGFSDAQREELWRDPSKLIGKKVIISYQELTSSGTPRFPVFIQFADTEEVSSNHENRK
jgi:DNA ligase-1